MREIKFRVWVESILEEETGMYIPEYISWAKNGDIHNIDKVYAPGWKFKEDTCKFTLMQYTGLKDKNGTEIYEGDIVKHESLKYPAEVKHGEHESGADDGYQAIDYGFYGKSQAPNWDGWFDVNILGLSDGEVIGNIYENPELLTKP